MTDKLRPQLWINTHPKASDRLHKWRSDASILLWQDWGVSGSLWKINGISIEDLMQYMLSVQKTEKLLERLNLIWTVIETNTKMNCSREAGSILQTMRDTNQWFSILEQQLILNLIKELINKTELDISSRSQVIIDIIIRNLYERTADVWFLATDNDIVEFIKKYYESWIDNRNSVEWKKLIDRLDEYVKKYSVYGDIKIFDLEWNLITWLKDDGIKESKSPLIKQTLSTDWYLETFGHIDFYTEQDKSLIYSQSIIDPDTGNPIWILTLNFKFQDEMEGIFKSFNLLQWDKSIMLLLDKDWSVIASSNNDHIPLDKKVKMVLDKPYDIIEIWWRDYLAVTKATRWYQWFYGAWWYGQVVIPIEQAFRKQNDTTLSKIDEDTMDWVLSHANSFCPALEDIAQRAGKIRSDLERMVWNWKIMASGNAENSDKLKAILDQISITWEETTNLFTNSIKELFETVVSSNLHHAQAISKLMIDIMDRNLYERANDCRWWALTEEIKKILKKINIDEEDIKHLTKILEYINWLYTVYTRLMVYDKDWKIIAASNLHKDWFDAVWKNIWNRQLEQTLGLSDTQAYSVSPFERSDFYTWNPTYIYNAAISDPKHPDKRIWGIGIVFDSQPQFEAMLKDALPENPGVFAIYTDEKGSIISATWEKLNVWEKLDIDKKYFSMWNDESISDIICYNGKYYIIWATKSNWYREYKKSGDYENNIIAFVFMPIWDEVNGWDKDAQSTTQIEAKTKETMDIATFWIWGKQYWVEAKDVLQAVEMSVLKEWTALWWAKKFLLWAFGFKDKSDKNITIPVINPCDLFSTYESWLSCTQNSEKQIIIINTKKGPIWLLVDKLGTVSDIDKCNIEETPHCIKWAHWFNRYIVNLSELMFSIIDPDLFLDMIMNNN